MDENNTKAAVEAGQAIMARAGERADIGGTPGILLPSHLTLKQFPEMRDRPVHLEQRVATTSHLAFVAYFNRFKDEDSIIFVDLEHHKFKGVLDYHQAAAEHEVGDSEGGVETVVGNRPRHGKHVVVYDCPLTPEARRWFDKNKVAMDQTEFARFIEDSLPEMMEPSGADMLEIATTLQVKNNVNFRSGIRLTDGQVNLTYNEEVQGGAGVEGTMKIPVKITIAVKLFRGDEAAYKIEANFRYRMKEGKLALWYELIRPHLAIEDAVKQIQAQVASGVGTEVPIIEAYLGN